MIPFQERLRQEECRESEAKLYSGKPARVIKQYYVLQKKKKSGP